MSRFQNSMRLLTEVPVEFVMTGKQYALVIELSNQSLGRGMAAHCKRGILALLNKWGHHAKNFEVDTYTIAASPDMSEAEPRYYMGISIPSMRDARKATQANTQAFLKSLDDPAYAKMDDYLRSGDVEAFRQIYLHILSEKGFLSFRESDEGGYDPQSEAIEIFEAVKNKPMQITRK